MFLTAVVIHITVALKRLRQLQERIDFSSESGKKMANATAAVPNATITCPAPMKATSNGSLQGENPLDFALPLIILQICIVVVLTRFLAFILRPLRQPRVIAEIIGGILLGPSALGRSERFLNTVFPKRSLTVLDTIANLGLLFFLFLVGLELDLRSIRRTGKRALAIAIAGISLPFILGIGTSVVLRSTVNKGVRSGPFLVFMGVALSITAFPVLARILAELKLLTTDLGRMAMSAAAVNDVAAWILLALAIALSGTGSPIISVWVLLAATAFILFIAFCVSPILNWMARHSPDGEPVKEVFICATLVIVLAAGFVTDAIGIHALFGAFVIGIFVPKDGSFAGLLIEKVEDLISGLFLPLYFVSSGLKTNVATISGGQSWLLLALVIATACFGKIVGTVVVAVVVKVPIKEAVTLGVLMNTKGLVELIVLNIGKDRKVLNDETFAILVLMALFTTFITTPLVTVIYKPARRPGSYKHRTIARADPTNTELRILACFHGGRSIPTIINLIESSRGTTTRRSSPGITVYAMHLMELSERSSAISMVHKARKNGLPFFNTNRKDRDSTDQVIVAFQAYQQLNHVKIRPMTAISDFGTIHEDITASAKLKKTAFVILPFHKQQQFDGTMESLGRDYQSINRHVLRTAPCSVGVLIDRGLGGTAQVSASEVSYAVSVLFFGGADDREALSYGSRIAEHPGISLKALRFKPPPGQAWVGESGSSGSVGIRMNADDRTKDESSLSQFAVKMEEMKESISYEEFTVSNKEETVAAMKGMERCNLILVGQGAPVMRLTEHRNDCPELGAVGGYLATSNVTTASVLVVKQYDPLANPGESLEDDEPSDLHPDTPRDIDSRD